MARNLSWESYPLRKTLDGWNEKYSSVDEFKLHLTADFLSDERCGNRGWVFGTEYSSGDLNSNNVFRRSITEKITHVLLKTTSNGWSFSDHTLLQFWAVEEFEGRCCLATSHRPFAVGCLAKGVCWLRKKCMQHYYYIADEDKQGPPGRVFRNGNPESSLDIQLYSTKEFSLRDFAVGCGLKSYLALPIFDVHHNQCVGVLEFIYTDILIYRLVVLFTVIYYDLQEVGLGLAHKYTSHLENLQSQPHPLPEIRGMLDLAIKSVPQLHLAQVWLPCNQCANNSSCMERKISRAGIDELKNFNDQISAFVNACGFHNIQNGQGIVGLALSSTNKSYFCENLIEFSITDYPMKHYVQLARLSSCFAICPRNKHNGNDICVFEFFLQPQSRDTATIQSILDFLLNIMEKELKSFEISTEQYFGTEQQSLEEHMLVIPMKIYEETFSVLEFKEFFLEVNLSRLHKRKEKNYGWICCSKKGEESSKNRGNDSSMPQINLGTEAIKLVLSEILSIRTWNDDFLIQFWVQKFVDNKLFLSTSEQPFALGYLRKGLCWYRKQCIQHLYYIGDGAKEEKLGPPGRVFLNGRPESSQDPRLYSRREFPLRDDLISSGARTYVALPLFGLLDKRCVGVLELLVLSPLEWNEIYKKLKVFCTRMISCHSSFPIAKGKIQNQAFSEIEEMLMLVVESPQLQTASVWIPCSQCARNNIEISCMERAKISCTNSRRYYRDWRIREFIKACEVHRPQITNGVIGKVLESESKMYFCEDLCSSSICQQPLAHYVQAARLEICFAICLKSWYTGNSLYVIEFFLSPHSTKYEYSRTLSFLLSIMKQMLKGFKIASGKLLAEELISEVHFEDVSKNITGFSTTNQLTVEKSTGQCIFPLGFENVQYSENQLHFSGIDDAIDIDQEQEQNIADDAIDIDQEQERNIANDAIDIDQEQERNIANDAIDVEDDAQNITDHVNFEEVNERYMSSTSFHVSYEQLKSQFGKSRDDAVKILGDTLSISTFKRKCRDYGIKRWPSRMNNINNPSLFTTADLPVDPNISSPPIPKTKELVNTCQSADVVIKAKFKDETLKFEFCVSWRMEKLKEEVGKRLNLHTSEFRLKYVDDDDGDLISLTCDEDLKFYVKTMKSIGKTSVQVLVHLIS